MQQTILHVISSLGGGGAEQQLLLYLEHQTGAWKHVVAYRKPYVHLHEEAQSIGVCTVWLGRGGFLRQLIRLLRVARAEAVDVIHTHLFEASILGRMAGRLLGLPVITTVTNTAEVEERIRVSDYAPWKYQLSLALEALTARLATDRMIAISQTVRESAVRTLRVPPSRIRVVYRAVGNGPANASTSSGLGPTLITTGRLVPHKGQDLLLRMFPLVLKDWPQCSLQVVGEGRMREALEHLAHDLGIASRVRFLGRQRDVHNLLEHADVFVYASWYEGFCNAFAEAIAQGLPVVAVDLPVFREIAPPSAVLLVERNARVFAEAVLRVLADLETFRRAAVRESASFRERFSIERYVRDTEAVYTEVARAGRAG